MSTRAANDQSYLQAMARFRSGDQIAAAPRRVRAVAEARLTTRQRSRLSPRQFALPARRALPIEDARHARNAAARLAQMRKRGTVSPAEYRRARAAITRAENKFAGQQPSRRRALRNPIAVRGGYRKGGSLQRDLTRYYDACTVSRSAGRFSGKARRDDYCARVAWTRARKTGRYRDYPGFTQEVAMATRRRNASGRFVKGKRKAAPVARKRPAASRRRTSVRRAAPRRRAAARRPMTMRRRTARRMSRAYEAMAPVMRMPRQGNVQWDVGNEEAPRRRRRPARRRAAAAPRRRRAAPRRHYARAAAAPMIVVANEYPGQPRTRRGTFTRGRRRVSRRRRSGYARERVCANRKRDRRGHFLPGRSRSGGTRRRRVASSTRRASGRRRRSTAGRLRRRNGQFGSTRVRGYSRNGIRVRGYVREEDLLDNPIGGALALDNPITMGETWTILGVAGAGWIVTDMVSRYLESTPAGYTAASGQVVVPNAVGELGMPSWTNIFVQTGIAVVGLGFGGYLGRRGEGGYGVAALNGLGIGAGLHLIGQLASAFLARLAGSKTSANGTTPNGLLARLYAPEIAAQNAQYQALATAQAANPPGTVVPGFAGLPGETGTVGALYNPANPYGAPTVQTASGPAIALGPNLNYPIASASQVAPAPGTTAPATPAPVTGSGSGSTTGWNGDQGGDCGCMGFTPYSTFPD